jgi:hypothetical protein
VANIHTFIDGNYTTTYDSVAIGPTEDGWSLEQTIHTSLIERSDAYGETLLDGFYRGGSYRVTADAQEYKAGTLAPFFPYGTFGVAFSASIPIGTRMSDRAKAFVMTSTANTPAAAAPASITFAAAVLAPGQTLRLNYNTTLRTVPIVLQALPTGTVSSPGVASTLTWFS